MMPVTPKSDKEGTMKAKQGKSVKVNCQVFTFMGLRRPVYTIYHPFVKNY